MSTSTPQPQLRLLPLRDIHVAEGANPRRCFDEQALAELADSIRQHGVLQPLVVTARPEGGYTLVAGERRHRAAKLAKLTEVPVAIRDDDQAAIELAVDENLHRRDLNPVEEAHAFQTILSSGRLTKKQLAERVSKSPQYVNERLRLLALPEQIQQHVAAGAVPVRMAKQLIEMAKVSEPVAVCCVQLVADGHAEVAELEERPERLIGCLGDHEWPDPQPIALAVSSYQHYRLEDVPLPDGCDDITQRVAAIGEPVGFRFGQEDADTARGYGCLLEIKRDRFFAHAYITDPVFIADRVRLQLDQLEKQAKQRQREAAKQAQHGDGAGGGDAGAEAEVERRRQERQQRTEAKEAAAAANFELGRKLQLRYDAPKITTQLAKLLALLILDRDADKLAGRGLRYVREDWQVVETVESRGKQVEKRRYPEGFEAAEQLYAQIERARNPEQVIGRLLQALLAAHAADEDALPQSKRIYWETPGRYGDGPSSEIPAILERLAKPVLPRALAAKRQPDTEDAAQAA
ncbi:MAG: ParB/RepB/Spo0J family partition protein [Acidobacteriota bacterium]|nr:ParB/RepB/Spo0J family partition protein [Acidobacteriota bacterium]